MDIEILEKIINQFGAQNIIELETIQTLWSGYGSIVRYQLIGAKQETIIVKHIQIDGVTSHPRGWNTNLSHQRKLKSYQVEAYWYENYENRENILCRMPHCFGVLKKENEILIMLEDLDAEGYPIRKNKISDLELENCIQWLANFHAKYLYHKPKGLWETGTYWHLETRPEELEALEDLKLKAAAESIDTILKGSPYQTIVHGDAKLANFCFSEKGEVAVVDFQYSGGGVGVKDLAYFVSSCFYENECEAREKQLLDCYFLELKSGIKKYNKAVDFLKLENNWRSLYSVAWADFNRFLKGWSPGHWKINSYNEKLTSEVLEKIIG